MTHAEMATHSLDFWLKSEDLPQLENGISYNGNGDIIFDYTANNLEPSNQLKQRLKDFLDSMNCHPDTHTVDDYLDGRIGIPLGHKGP